MLEFLELAFNFFTQPFPYITGGFVIFLIVVILFKADAINSKKDPDEYLIPGLMLGLLAALVWPTVVILYSLYLVNLFLNVLAKMFSESTKDKSKES